MARVEFKDMINFEEEIVERYKLFEGLDLVPLESYLGMDTKPALAFKKPMASGGYRAFRIKGSDKVDKIAYGELHYLRRAKYCALNMTAGDDYDLPVFACECDESAKRLSITVDLMPVVDIALYPEYRQKYMKPLAEIWRKHSAIPGLTEDGRCLVQRRYGPWPWARESLSPYPIDGRITGTEDRPRVLDAVADYARVWLKLLEDAEPIQDETYKKEMLARKRAMQKYYRDLDPGGEVLKKIFGEGGEKLIVSLIF